MYKVYKIQTNCDRIYIGCTSQSLSRRISEHKFRKREFVLQDFQIEILGESNDAEKALVLEAYYIEKFSACDPDKGWNRRLGGNKWSFPDFVQAGFGKRTPAAHPGESNGMYGRTQSEETREKIRQRAIGRKSALKGVKLSEEQKAAKREKRGNKGYSHGEQHPWFGRTHTDEVKAKLSESAKGHQRWLGRKHSEESKRKMSEAKRLKRLALSDPS